MLGKARKEIGLFIDFQRMTRRCVKLNQKGRVLHRIANDVRKQYDCFDMKRKSKRVEHRNTPELKGKPDQFDETGGISKKGVKNKTFNQYLHTAQ